MFCVNLSSVTAKAKCLDYLINLLESSTCTFSLSISWDRQSLAKDIRRLRILGRNEFAAAEYSYNILINSWNLSNLRADTVDREWNILTLRWNEESFPWGVDVRRYPQRAVTSSCPIYKILVTITYLLLFMRDKSDGTPDIINTCVGGSFFELDSYIV